MAKNPVKGFTLGELEEASSRAQIEMAENAEILNKQNPETGGPNYEKIEEFDHAGADGHDGPLKRTDSPLNAYVSTAGHFQSMQDKFAAAFTPKKKTGPTSEDKKNQAMEDYYKSLTKTSEKPETEISYDKAIESGITEEQMEKVFDAGSTIGKFI